MLNRLYWASLHRKAFFADIAHVFVKRGHRLTDDAEIIKIWLYAVIRATANTYFELVRQFHSVPTFIESMMYFFGKCLSIVKAVQTYSTLASHYGTYNGTCAAGN